MRLSRGTEKRAWNMLVIVFSGYAENQGVGGYEMKLDRQVGPVQSHAKDFVLYSKG